MSSQKIPKKVCTSCKREKKLTEFYKDARKRDGRTAQCKKCRSKKYDRTPAKRCANLRYRYGISLEEFEFKLAEQGGACALCAKKYIKGNNRFHVDHCHENGHIRGILCHDCNTALGKLGDTVESIEKVLEYLKSDG